VISVPRRAERPKYRQLADELRRRIEAGALPPGAPLPSETALGAEFDLSRNSVRQAVALLRAEGLVVTEHGRASYVRPQLPVKRMGAERYRIEAAQVRGEGPPETSFTRDQGIAWADYRLDREYHEVPASEAIADLLQVEPGTMLLERRFVFYSVGYPQQMSTSYYPLEMVAGTRIVNPDSEPWKGGNVAQLASIGVRVTRVRERIRARMPVTDEVNTLRIPSGVPVIAITRQMFAGDRPVEACVDIVIPADRVELDYEIEVPDPEQA
jgi:GntR family transcriptional regulator